FDESLRYVVCHRRECSQLFFICRCCDCGHRYCGRKGSRLMREASLRRARRRHRDSPEGRDDHRDRQREYRRRRAARVVDHGANNLPSAVLSPEKKRRICRARYVLALARLTSHAVSGNADGDA
ncbi:MAG: hypothetical protein K0V04_27270, partial [Deltaproteobacteria bacterium]|nr:hypothetical protein [Deltaproteobacteria bacterium]